MAAYYKLMVDAATFLGANRSVAEKEMFEALQFGKQDLSLLRLYDFNMLF